MASGEQVMNPRLHMPGDASVRRIAVLRALFLGDLLDMFKSRGWKLIDADQAFKDEVFAAAPNILPAGESIIWSLAKETGKFDAVLRYPGEDGDYEKAEMDRLGL